MFGKIASDLQSGVAIEDHAVSGTLNWVEGYTGFSSNPAEQQGNYIALTVDTEALGEQLDDCVITCHIGENDVVLDSDKTIVIRYTGRVDEISFTAEKEGYTTGVITLDLSTLTLTPEPAKFSLVCNTPGITFTPSGEMAGGMATFEITATGQVPYDTTTSSNLISMTLTTNASPTYDQTGDSILVAYLDSQEDTHTLYTGSLTWNDNVGTATFNCPITADSITYSPVIAIVIDETNATRVSQVLDTSALTLEPAPVPKFTVSSPDITFNPAGLLGNGGSRTATGEIPYDTTTSANNTSITITTNDLRDFSWYGDIDSIAVAAEPTPVGPDSWFSGSLTLDSSTGIASGTISTTYWGWMSNSSYTGTEIIVYIKDNNYNTLATITQTVDVSGITLQPDPTPRMNITSADQAVSITPATFNVSKAATGEAPYNTSGSYNYLPISLAYTGTWDQNYYRIEVFDSSSVSIYDTPAYMGSSNLPSVLGVPITSGDIGTGKYLDVTIFSGETSQSQSNPVNTIRIDTSALTLEAAPTPEVNITSNTTSVNVTPATYSATKTASGTLLWDPSFSQIDNFSIQLKGNAYVSSSRYTITAYIEDDSTLVVGRETNKSLTSAFNMNCNIAAYLGTASYITIAFSPNDLPSITIDISGVTASDGAITPSGITYQGQTYSTSDFISGGTVTRSYNNTVIDGATIKYATVNEVSGYYLAFSIPYTRYTGGASNPTRVQSIPTTADYEALVVDTSGFPSVNLVHFLGNAPANITINILYPSGIGESSRSIELRFTNCTFEQPT